MYRRYFNANLAQHNANFRIKYDMTWKLKIKWKYKLNQSKNYKKFTYRLNSNYSLTYYSQSSFKCYHPNIRCRMRSWWWEAREGHDWPNLPGIVIDRDMTPRPPHYAPCGRLLAKCFLHSRTPAININEKTT